MEGSLLVSRRRAKNEKMRHISACVLSLDINKGHLHWKVTELVRRARVSRGIVYRYFGSTKEEILTNSVKTFVANLIEIMSKANSTPLPEVLFQMRAFIEQYPDTALFYQRWRGHDGLIQKEFIAFEEEIQRTLKLVMPSLTEEELLTATVLVYGLTTAPFISSSQVRMASQEILKKKDLKILSSKIA